MAMWQLWIVLAAVLLGLEMITGGLYMLCFALGAAAALVASLLFPVWVQLAVLAAVSAVAVFWVRPFVKAHLHRDGDTRVSNADALLGRTGRVREPIEAGGYGWVAIDGDVWKADTDDGQAMDRGTKCKVVARRSTIITVTRN